MRKTTQIARSIWDNKEFSNRRGTEDLQKLFHSSKFAYPKSEHLIKRILEIATINGDIVLDYHLGSGTTAAVAHKMGRQYIGIEQMDYIKDVTLERMNKVLTGEQGGISGAVEWQGGGEFVYCELKKYNEVFIEQIQAAGDTAELKKIWKDMKEKSFLDWNVDLRKLEEAFTEWEKSSLNRQKKALIELLDMNQLYVNYSEMDDKNFKCSDAEKKFSASFYGNK